MMGGCADVQMCRCADVQMCRFLNEDIKIKQIVIRKPKIVNQIAALQY